jgi:hypothetical protein
MKRSALVLTLLCAPPASAHEHGLYDYECCSDKDCSALEPSKVELVPGGYMIQGRHVIPFDDSRLKWSRDGAFHACVRPMAWHQGRPWPEMICLYRPQNSAEVRP